MAYESPGRRSGGEGRCTYAAEDRKTSKQSKSYKRSHLRIYASMQGMEIEKIKQKGRRADALALRADERRDKLR